MEVDQEILIRCYFYEILQNIKFTLTVTIFKQTRVDFKVLVNVMEFHQEQAISHNQPNAFWLVRRKIAWFLQNQCQIFGDQKIYPRACW